MESKRIHLKRIFVCILGAATVIFISLNFDSSWSISNTIIKIGNATFRSRVTPPTMTTTTTTTTAPSSTSAEPRWEKPGPYHVAYPRNYKFIMDDTWACRTKSPFLIMMVPIAPSDVSARNAIRKTWGNETVVKGEVVKTLFVVGLPGGADAGLWQENLIQENDQHHDLIQSNFQDNYRNLTIKTMVMLEWVAANCGNASYVMKIDSDMLVNVPNLVKLLLDPSTAKQNYTSGLVWWHSPVVRNPSTKFYLPPEVMAEPEYPPYPLGMAYVMSLDLPAKILRVPAQIKPIYIEDVYLGMCLKHLGISPTDPPESYMFIVDPVHPLSYCTVSKIIAVTTTSTAQMTSYWDMTKDPDARC